MELIPRRKPSSFPLLVPFKRCLTSRAPLSVRILWINTCILCASRLHLWNTLFYPEGVQVSPESDLSEFDFNEAISLAEKKFDVLLKDYRVLSVPSFGNVLALTLGVSAYSNQYTI